MATKKLTISESPDSNLERKRDKSIVYSNYEMDMKYQSLGLGYFYYIETHGCQANFLDEQNITGILNQASFTRVTNKEEANIIIVNTCSVRQSAENKTLGEIGRLKAWKDEDENRILCLCGCMAQLESNIILFKKSYSHLDLVFGTNNLSKLLSLFAQVILEKKKIIEVSSESNVLVDSLPRFQEQNHKAFVNIMFGCDAFCTYCIVPLTRGVQKSRLKEDILNEINSLILSGCKEVTLLGQNVNSYGLDFKDREYNFASLLEDIANTNIPRIRYLTSHPRDFTIDIVRVMEKHKNICPHIHLPLQSGNDRILRKMNRHYDIKHYYSIIDEIKKSGYECSITTDIIVGFPSETEEEFFSTLEAIEKVGFSGGYNFIFSARKNTPAYSMSEQIPLDVKKDRHLRLSSLSDYYSLMYNKAMVGKVYEILVDSQSHKANKDGQLTLSGYTMDFRLVNFVGTLNLIGSFVNVRILEAKSWFLQGEIVE
jgi:tRNA-2-methylthio-N6-dimethylallyladenosine synthase